MRAPQGLAVNGNHLAGRQHIHRLDPFQKAALKFRRVQGRKDPPEGVMRGNPIWQLQEPAEPFFLGLAKFGHFHPTIRATDHRANGDQDDVQQLVRFRAVNPGIRQGRKTRSQRADSYVFQAIPRVLGDTAHLTRQRLESI